MRKNTPWNLLIFLAYAVGVILFLIPRLRDFGVYILIGAVALHITYTFSPRQRAAIKFLNARKSIEKGDVKKAFQFVIQGTALSDEKTLVNYLLSPFVKLKPYYMKLASMLENELNKNDTPFLRYIIASIYYQTGEMNKVFTLLKDLSKKELDIKTIRLLGASMMEKGDYESALKLFKRVEPKRKVPNLDELNVLLGIGLCYADTGNIKKAKEYYERVAKFNPSLPGLNKLYEKIHLEKK